MTLNRHRPRAPIINNRNTIPSPQSSLPDTAAAGLTLLPSVEESLQTWLNTSTSEEADSSLARLLASSCRCCGQAGCDAFETLGSAIKQLEEDARLAAEIGQGLLHKHDAQVLESAAVKDALEQQLEQERSQRRELEHMLNDADTASQQLQEQQDRTAWDLKKAQKALQEIESDLVVSNARCMELANELKDKTFEVEKLRIFKLMVKQADVREESLRGKLEDANQELAISRKNELMLESKLKKLKTRYESLLDDHERLKRKQGDCGLSEDDRLHMEWLKESNAKLQKLTASLVYPSSKPASLHQSEMMAMIQELVAANEKLKEDLQECNHYAADTHLPMTGQTLESGQPHQEEPCVSPLPTSTSWLSTSAPPAEDGIIRTRLWNTPKSSSLSRQTDSDSDRIRRAKTPSPTSSTSFPTSKQAVVHHHYHYYLKRKNMHEKTQTLADDNRPIRPPTERVPDADRFEEDGAGALEEEDETRHGPIHTRAISPTSSLKTSCSQLDTGLHDSTNDAPDAVFRTPYDQLQSSVSQLLRRLRATDIRALNRQLKRAFDILELSPMSNTMIEAILVEIATLSDQFAWPHAGQKNKVATVWSSESCLEAFLPIMQLSQDMLTEIGQLRSTMNDLQLDYVRKMEVRGALVEQKLLQQGKEDARKRSPPPETSSNATSIGALAWLSSVFQRAARKEPSADSIKGHPKILVRSTSVESIPTVVAQDSAIQTHASHTKTISPTSTLVQTIRRKKSDIDRHGPASSFPRTAGDKRRPKTMTAPQLKASYSAGSVLRSHSTQVPRAEGATRRKRSTLCGTPPTNDFLSGGSKPNAADVNMDWDVGSAAFSSSWLGSSSFPAGIERIDT